MSKAVKQMQIDDLKRTFHDVRDMVLLSISGLNATHNNQMRLGLRKKGIRLQIVKNSLAKRVFDGLGVKFVSPWEGNTVVAWGGTSIAELAKEVDGLIKKNDKFMKVKTAVAEGQELPFDQALKMPTRTEAIGQVIGLALSPASRLVSQILGPGSALASQIKKVSEKKEEAAASPA